MADAVFNTAHGALLVARPGARRLGPRRAAASTTACTSRAASTSTRARWSSCAARARSARSARRSRAPARPCSCGATTRPPAGVVEALRREAEGWARGHARALRAPGRGRARALSVGRAVCSGDAASCSRRACARASSRPERGRAARRPGAGSPRRGRAGGRGSRPRARPTRRRRSTGARRCSSSLSPTCSLSESYASRECTVRMSAMLKHDAEPLEVGVQAVARQLDDLERLLDALQREVLRLGAEQRVVGGDERVDGQQAERRRAVDEDDVVVVVDVLQRAAQRQLAAHLAGQRQLGLGQREVGGDDAVVDGRRRPSRGPASTSPIVGSASGSTSK